MLCGLLFAATSVAQNKAAADPDGDCLVCHNNKDLKSDSGRSLYVDPAKRKAGVHSVLNCTSCHADIKEYPHPKRIAKVECAACHAEQGAEARAGIHGALGEEACAGCHGSAHSARAASAVMPQQCAACHKQEVREFLSSAHGAAMKAGGAASPTCESCHGPVHKILAAGDPQSPVAKQNLANTCAACHSSPAFLARDQIPFAHPVEAYRLSVHGRATAAGNEKAAACSDCHSSHAILPGRDARSKTNHWNISNTCGACHGEIKKVYDASVHGAAAARGAPDAPVCTDCHGEHTILAAADPRSSVNPDRVSAVTCGRCHGDQRIADRYNLPADRVPTFADSFHGLAARSGSQTVANCASCHGVHNIFPSSDPRSTVNAANLAHTCGNCHPGAGQSFAIGSVHVGAASRAESGVVKWIRRVYWTLISLTLLFMVFHHAIDFRRKAREMRARESSGPAERMNLHFRIAHWMVVASFPVLVVTGFALKFPDAWWARPVLMEEGRMGLRGGLHRAAAAILLVAVAYHVLMLLLDRRDRAVVRTLLPNLGDIHQLQQAILYNLGLTSVRPSHSGGASYVEKIEYWAFVWGTCVMAATGFMLWFNNFALRHFPKWVEDASTALHFYEAILATAAILVWHMYTVIFDPDVYPMDSSWISGKRRAHHEEAAENPPQAAPQRPLESEPVVSETAPASASKAGPSQPA